jgi:hypothetical protein
MNKMDMQAVVDGEVENVWHKVVYSCNKIMDHAQVYGIKLMDIPEPNIHQLAKSIEKFVIPLLDELARDYDFSPESGIRVANIKTLSIHLRELIVAIDEQDVNRFNQVIALLNNEPMLI